MSTQKLVRMSRMRQTIAKRMMESKQNTATLTSFTEIDMTRVQEVRKQRGMSLMPFFLKACSDALTSHPIVNAFVQDKHIAYNQEHNIGIAVATPTGLVVPVIRNCEQKSLEEINEDISDVTKRGREGKIEMKDMQGGTFTVTNGGVFGSILATPMLNPPQSGIFGMHALEKRPVVVDDEIQIRLMMYAALSYDHRIIDGRDAVGFLMHVKESISKAE